MSSYEIEARSATGPVIEAYKKRGFDVVVAALSWHGAQGLAKSLGLSSQPRDLMVVSTLARKVHEAQRDHKPGFSHSSLVVLPATDAGHLDSADWNLVRHAAEMANDEVVFLYAQP